MIVNKQSKQVPVGDLKSHPDNPRKGNIDALAESIRINGFYGAIVVQQSTGYILVGNHRWQAAKAVGLKKVPVIYVDVDDEGARKILLADNRTSDMSTYDESALVKLLSSIDLAGTGYDESDLDDIIARLDLPAPIGVPTQQRGGGEAGDSSVLQWGYMQWKSTRVRISPQEVTRFDDLYNKYVEENLSDVGFGHHLLGDADA